LGVEALRQGNHQVVEAAYQKTKNLERLSFLYLITGNTEKLSKMLQIAVIRNDIMSRFHNSLYLGNVEERVKVLRDAGQVGFALLTARTHGLTELAAEIEAKFSDAIPKSMPAVNPSAELLLPSVPILKTASWPLLEVRSDWWSLSEKAEEEEKTEVPEQKHTKRPQLEGDEDQSDDEGKAAITESKVKEAGTEGTEEEGGGWDPGLGEIELPSGPDDKAEETPFTAQDIVIVPKKGKTAAEKWVNNSVIAADLAAAGDFKMAMHLLKGQIGCINFEPLKAHMLNLSLSAHCYLPMMSGSPPLELPLMRVENKDGGLPSVCLKMESCVEQLKMAYVAVTDGKFRAAMQHFLDIIQILPLLVVDKKQAAEVQELLNICSQYITALRIETARKDSTDPARQAVLSAYFTQCKVQDVHLILGLRVAIKAWYQIANYKTTATLCRRMLELCQTSNQQSISRVVNAKLLQQIQGVLKVCEQKNEESKPLDYDDSKSSVICCETLTPIYRGQPSVACPYCKSS
jgi:coatomer protein complex subunit alpha (xenin)